MPDKRFIDYLSDFARMIVFFHYDKKILLNFVVKLEIRMNEGWKEIERFDCYHDCVHKDILNRKGEKKRVIKYEMIDLKAGLDFATMDFKQNYQVYMWRYLNDKE